MPQRKNIAIRSLAIANLAFAAWGYYDLSHSVHESTVPFPPNYMVEFPHTELILSFMLVLTGLLLSSLVWGSIHLLRSQSIGFPICCFVYGVEIGLWFIDIPIRYISLWWVGKVSQALP